MTRGTQGGFLQHQCGPWFYLTRILVKPVPCPSWSFMCDASLSPTLCGTQGLIPQEREEAWLVSGGQRRAEPSTKSLPGVPRAHLRTKPNLTETWCLFCCRGNKSPSRGYKCIPSLPTIPAGPRPGPVRWSAGCSEMQSGVGLGFHLKAAEGTTPRALTVSPHAPESSLHLHPGKGASNPFVLESL